MSIIIPTSGDILRSFSRTSMAAASRHVAEVLAGHIAYTRGYRGAPKGFSAWTMAELQNATGLSERTVREALTELARLFGLVMIRRHHQRHFFRFTRITAGQADGVIEGGDGDAEAVAPAGVTGSPVPVTPYSKENRINNLSGKIEVSREANVHRTPWADFIKRFKVGTPAEKMDAQYLWNGFCGLNRRNGRERVPLAFLIGFLRKYPTTAPSAPAATAKPASPVVTQTPAADAAALTLADMARAAPFSNRQWHKSDLIRLIGQPAYDARVEALIDRYGGGRFSAELAVHGQAARAGEIKP